MPYDTHLYIIRAYYHWKDDPWKGKPGAEALRAPYWHVRDEDPRFRKVTIAGEADRVGVLLPEEAREFNRAAIEHAISIGHGVNVPVHERIDEALETAMLVLCYVYYWESGD